MSEENIRLIKALNMYGRVPEQYELLEEIERLKIIEEKYKDSQLYIHDFKEEIEKLNNKEERLMRRLEDLIIIGEQVENEWAVDICKMIIEELKGSDKE